LAVVAIVDGKVALAVAVVGHRPAGRAVVVVGGLLAVDHGAGKRGLVLRVLHDGRIGVRTDRRRSGDRRSLGNGIGDVLSSADRQTNVLIGPAGDVQPLHVHAVAGPAWHPWIDHGQVAILRDVFARIGVAKGVILPVTEGAEHRILLSVAQLLELL